MRLVSAILWGSVVMKRCFLSVCGLAVVGAACLVAPAAAEVELADVFSDHMVLQRDLPVSVFGRGMPGEAVSVTFRGRKQEAVVGADGGWRVTFEPLAAGGPDELVVAGRNTITLRDVLVGEVWVGSGQSNMAGRASGYARNDAELERRIASGPQPKLRLLHVGDRWTEATPATAGGFSALLFAYGWRLQAELDVPVGLMLGAMGGTPSGAWLSEAALAADADCQRQLAAFAATWNAAEEERRHDAIVAAWERQVAAAKAAGNKEPRRPPPLSPPGMVRGQKPGFLYEKHIRPVVGFTIRGVLWDQGEGGTGLGGVDQYTLMGGLIRGWRHEWGQGEFPFLYVQKPSGGGCTWDPADPATARADAFAALPATVPADGGSVEMHVKIMQHPRTAMVIASDLGGGVHPVNKSAYADRAARVALGMVYGRPLEYYGPLYDRHAVEGKAVRVHFTHAASGLAFRHGERLQGFAVAGEDRVFRFADAVIDGETVVVSSPQVPQPVAVRYAWAQNRPWANLFNRDGLPAVPFRTDDWEVTDGSRR